MSNLKEMAEKLMELTQCGGIRSYFDEECSPEICVYNSSKIWNFFCCCEEVAYEIAIRNYDEAEKMIDAYSDSFCHEKNGVPVNSVGPLPISDDMKADKQKRIDKAIAVVNKDIQKAIDMGWHDTSFNVDVDDSVYEEVKKAFTDAGYRIVVNIYARCGGVNEKIQW